MVIKMKKIFNKSFGYGLLFAVSSYWLYYLPFLMIPLFPFLDNIEFINDNMSYIGGGILIGFPIHYGVISIPVYFLLRRRVKNKALFTAVSMYASIILEIPLYILAELSMEDSGYVGNFMRVMVLGFLFLVIIATFLLCFADTVISMIKQRKFSILRTLSVMISGAMVAGIILIIYEIENWIL